MCCLVYKQANNQTHDMQQREVAYLFCKHNSSLPTFCVLNSSQIQQTQPANKNNKHKLNKNITWYQSWLDQQGRA